MQSRALAGSPWLWLAAGIAFSPALAEIAGQTVSNPRTTTPIIAGSLLVLASVRCRVRETPGRTVALGLLAAAAVLEILGILGGSSTFARVSVPVAVVGVSRMLGHPPLATALLSLWLVPIPVSLLEPLREPFENGAAAFVAAVGSLVSPDAVAVGPLVRASGRSFELRAPDAGLHLAHLLALVGWYGAVLRGEGLGAAARMAGKTALLTLPLQPIFLAVAALALLAVGPSAARGVLDPGLPALVLVTALPWAERGRRRSVKGLARP